MRQAVVILVAIAFMAANVSSAFSQGGEPSPPKGDPKSGKKSSTGTPKGTTSSDSTSTGQTKK